jgi:hypothetical protein
MAHLSVDLKTHHFAGRCLQIAGFPIERVQQDSVVSVQLHVVRNRYLELAERDRFAERLKSGVAGSKEC